MLNKLEIENEKEKFTGKIYNGKNLYIKEIDYGLCTNSSYRDVVTGLTDVTIVSLSGIMQNTNAPYNYISLPYFDSFISYQTQTNMVRIQNNTDRSTWQAKVYIEYIKN